MFHWFCGLYVHFFDKVQEEKEAKYHPLTRSACRRSLVKILRSQSHVQIPHICDISSHCVAIISFLHVLHGVHEKKPITWCICIIETIEARASATVKSE